jgi:hypothetical protein
MYRKAAFHQMTFTNTSYPCNFALSNVHRANNRTILPSGQHGCPVLTFERLRVALLPTRHFHNAQHQHMSTLFTRHVHHLAWHSFHVHSLLSPASDWDPCQPRHRCAPRPSPARAPTNTALNFRTSSKLSTICNQFYAARSSLKSYAVAQEISVPLCNPRFITKFKAWCILLVPVLSEMNPDHASYPILIRLHRSTGFPSGLFPLRFPTQMYFSFPPCANPHGRKDCQVTRF